MAAAKKPAAKRKAAPKRAAAAVAEVTPEPESRSVAWQGLTITLPQEMPAAMLMQVVELEATSESNPMPILRSLRKILGPEQYTRVTHALPDEGDWEAVFGLFNQVLAEYGLTAGE